ncbi:MAG: hypothetical protein Kow00129_01610 [Thermoleophilia bacterium]
MPFIGVGEVPVNLEALAKIVLLAGAVLVLLGALFYLASRLGITHLPGDIVWKGERTTIYFPLGLSIVASLILTILLNLFLRR